MVRLGWCSFLHVYFFTSGSSWRNIYHVSLICQEDSTSNPVYYILIGKGDDVTKIPNYDENNIMRKTDQEKECESDYKNVLRT